MSLDIHSRVDAGEIFEPESESDFDTPWGDQTWADQTWAESAVTVAATAFTVLFVSSVAVLMYLA
jgi:hypothetical protein